MKKLTNIDARLSARMRIVERNRFSHTMAAIFAHSGDSWFWLLGLGLLWLLGTDYWRERALTMIVGILITAGIVMLIKFTVRRSRPVGNWGGIYRKTDPHSFPSGHAARAALLATLAIGLGPAWFGLLLLIWAPLVTLSRAAMGVHYLLDVVVGAVIGVIMGVLFLVPSFNIA
jgi:undecaprenyl-diphosphatase